MKSFLITILIALLSTHSHGQVAFAPRWSVNLEFLSQTTGIYSESYRIPGVRTQIAGGKGFQLGAEYMYVGKKRGQFFQNLALLKYGSRTETGLGAMTSLGYRLGFARAFVEGQAGIGYLQTTFRQNRDLQKDNGSFFSEKFRIAGLSPTFALGAGCYVSEKWTIYLRYAHHAQLAGDIMPGGVRLHRNLNLGVGFKI